MMKVMKVMKVKKVEMKINTYLNQELNARLSNVAKIELHGLIQRHVREQYFGDASSSSSSSQQEQQPQSLHYPSMPRYYKTCYIHLQQCKVNSARKYEQQQRARARATRVDEQCSKLLSKFLLFVVVPLTTLLLTLFLVGFILKNTVGKPQFMKLWEENWRKKKDDPTRIDVNLNEYTDFWWILTLAPLGISVIIWYAWMLLFNVKQLWAHVNRVQRSNSSIIIISLPLVLLCTFASFVMCGTLVTLRFTFPYDSESICVVEKNGS